MSTEQLERIGTAIFEFIKGALDILLNNGVNFLIGLLIIVAAYFVLGLLCSKKILNIVFTILMVLYLYYFFSPLLG